MEDDLIGGANLLFDEKGEDMIALIARELDDFAHFGVDDDGAIAIVGSFESLGDLLGIEILGETLDAGDGLAAVPLLNADMNLAAADHGLLILEDVARACIEKDRLRILLRLRRLRL